MEEDREVIPVLERAATAVRSLHRVILLGEEGDAVSWSLLTFFMVAYVAFSLALITVYGSTVVMEFTRFAHDNMAHLYIPRAVIDNGPSSKLANLGTVWLPLYHILLIPLVSIDPLYYTGLAGALLNALFIAATASAIYIMVKGYYGLLAASLYGASAYSLIHASSSYMAPAGQFLAFASTLYGVRYIRTSSLRDLTKAVAFAMFASVARYEAWLVLLGLTLAVAVRELGRRRWVIPAYVPPAWLGVVGWLAYNWAIFGDPLIFFYGRFYGAGTYYSGLVSRMLNPASIDYGAAAWVVAELSSPPSLILAPAGLAYAVIRWGSGWRDRLALLTMLSSPLALLAISGEGLAIGDIPLYFYFISPWLFALSALGARAFWGRGAARAAVAAAVAALFVGGAVMTYYQQYGVLGEELGSAALDYVRYRVDVAGVRGLVGDGPVLSPIAVCSFRLSLLGRMSPSSIIDEYDGARYRDLQGRPWEGAEAVIVPVEEVYAGMRGYLEYLGGGRHYVISYYENSTWRGEFLTHYTPAGMIGDEYIVYVLKPG